MGKVIKIMLQSFFDASGVSKMRNAVRTMVGDVGDLSGALKKLGSIFGMIGGAAGGLFANILKGGVWGVMAEGVRIVIGLIGSWRDKEKAAAEEVEKAAKAAYDARIKAVNDYAAAVEKAHAAANKANDEHLRLINAEVDATNNLKKALLELEAVRARKRGDTDAAARAESELSGLDAEAAEAKMRNMMEAAANKRYDAQRLLENLGTGREQAQAVADAESKRMAEEIAKVRSKAAASATGRAMTSTISGAVVYAAATEEERKAAADAAEAAYKQGDAYKAIAERLDAAKSKVSEYATKITEAQNKVESLTAEEKTLATNFDALLASNTAKAEREALAAEESLKATQKKIEEEKRKSLERQAEAEWKADQDRIAVENEVFEEQQKLREEEAKRERQRVRDSLADAIKAQREKLANLKTGSGDADKALRDAQSKVQQAWGWYRDKRSMAAQLKEERANAKAEARYEKDFSRLSRRSDWRTATNLSIGDEAVRRVAIAREEEAAAKKAAIETAENTKVAAEKLKELTDKLDETMKVS